jgi:hypothetical protein
MKPVTKSCKRGKFGRKIVRVLTPENWSHIMAKKLWHLKKNRCTYSFKVANVGKKIKIYGKCSQCKCDILITEVCEDLIQNHVFDVQFSNIDLSFQHSKKKRRIIGAYRKEIIDQRCNTSSVMIKSSLTSNEMDYGDPEPSHIPNSKAISEAFYRDKSKVRIHNNPLLALQIMKHRGKYSGSIHDIGLDPILVIYFSNIQSHLYNDLNQNSNILISADATGGLCKQVKVYSKNGENIIEIKKQIYLYQINAVTENINFPV